MHCTVYRPSLRLPVHHYILRRLVPQVVFSSYIANFMREDRAPAAPAASTAAPAASTVATILEREDVLAAGDSCSSLHALLRRPSSAYHTFYPGGTTANVFAVKYHDLRAAHRPRNRSACPLEERRSVGS